MKPVTATTSIVGLLAGMAACQHVNGPSADESVQTEPTLVIEPMNLHGQVAFSIRDLARRLDVPSTAIRVSGARQVTWRSGALGCPEPGMNYIDALVPGSVIYLQVDNAIHAYHGKIGAEPFYCPRERVEQPVPDDDRDPT